MNGHGNLFAALFPDLSALQSLGKTQPIARRAIATQPASKLSIRPGSEQSRTFATAFTEEEATRRSSRRRALFSPALL